MGLGSLANVGQARAISEAPTRIELPGDVDASELGRGPSTSGRPHDRSRTMASSLDSFAAAFARSISINSLRSAAGGGGGGGSGVGGSTGSLAAGPTAPPPLFRPRPFRAYAGHTAAVLDLAFSRHNFLLSASMDRTVRLWHLTQSECLCVFEHPDAVTVWFLFFCCSLISLA